MGATVTAPADSGAVLDALRLGWYVAEVRGRNRLDAPTPGAGVVLDRSHHALPLRAERTPTELRIEAQNVLQALVTKLGVDTTVDGASLVQEVGRKATELANDVRQNFKEPAMAASDELDELVYNLDKHIQDAFAAASEMSLCAYGLGRGLAEAYWALDAAASGRNPVSASSWEFLLGDGRCKELSRLVGRLGPYFDEYTAPAIAGSLAAWRAVATDKDWRAQNGAVDDLYQQTRRWYELLILGQDPTTLVKPFAIIRSARNTKRILALFGPQLLSAGLSLAALVAAIWFIATGTGTPAGKTILGVVGALGLSLTSIQTKLKSSAQALVTRLRHDIYTDLVATAITIVPQLSTSKKLPGTTSSTDRAVIDAVRNRELTTAVAA